jgi:hypothetical protein
VVPARATRRAAVFHAYRRFAAERDARDMDAICRAGVDSGFRLQAQQEFLKAFVADNEGWDRLLLYHQIGSGKTCTAITLAEEYMRGRPRVRATVILPARLHTNFVGELLSPCGGGAYARESDVPQKYDILSFEGFVNAARAGAAREGGLARWAQDFTRNRLLIVDEVHNLLSASYDVAKLKQMLDTGVMPAACTRTLVFKYLAARAHPSCKMLFLTATPVFDSLPQFREVVAMLNPKAETAPMDTLAQAIKALRGRVSYFPGTSPAAYPGVRYVSEAVEMSATQDAVIAAIQEQDRMAGAGGGGGEQQDDLSEAFLSRQRQATVACLPDNASIRDRDKEKYKANLARVVSDLPEYAPKVARVLDLLRTHAVGKHLVYCSFVEAGARVLEAALRREGWVSLQDVRRNEALWLAHKHKVFATWEGEVSNADKRFIKDVVNDARANLDGSRVRLVIGSPSIKEGVSFKHIQHMHVLDPVWNPSAKAQVEGRAVRFCSHADIRPDHPQLRRAVDVHLYRLVPRPGGEVEETPDMRIYDDIIPAKQGQLAQAEHVLKRVAIDYHLFRRLHEANGPAWDGVPETRVDPENSQGRSRVLLDFGGGVADTAAFAGAALRSKTSNTCPRDRRPKPDAVTGRLACPPAYPYLRKNRHKVDCCFKKPL